MLPVRTTRLPDILFPMPLGHRQGLPIPADDSLVTPSLLDLLHGPSHLPTLVAPSTPDLRRHMNAEERLIAMDRELADTRRAAVGLVLGMVDAIARTPFEREEFARTFEEAATSADEVTARLACLVAGAVRRG